jgi:hypothetical protein
MRIADLLATTDRSFASIPEMDPLTEENALQEAALLAIAADSMSSSVGVLLDLRLALQLRSGNVGLLVVRQVDHLVWSDSAPASRKWHVVGESVPENQNGNTRIRLGLISGATFSISGRTSEFYVGTVPFIQDAPPDLTSSDRTHIAAQLPNWESPIQPIHATFVDPI